MCLYHSCKCLASFYAVSSVCLSTAVNVLCVLSSDRRGIEWISLSGFISFATSTPNNLGLVRNELQLVDLPTGRSVPFRGERGNDEPAIEMIKVSHLK